MYPIIRRAHTRTITKARKEVFRSTYILYECVFLELIQKIIELIKYVFKNVFKYVFRASVMHPVVKAKHRSKGMPALETKHCILGVIILTTSGAFSSGGPS